MIFRTVGTIFSEKVFYLGRREEELNRNSDRGRPREGSR